MRQKKGQFFLIAAVVIIVVIVSIATVSNYTQKKEVIKLYDLGQELGIESQQVLDYGTYSELNDTQMQALMESFIRNYVTYIQQDKNIYFVYGNKEKINVVGYQDVSAEQVCVRLNPVTKACGNGIVEINEECDDNNTINGDGCSSSCKLETFSANSSCGNEIVEGNEECDEGASNGVAGNECSSECTLINPTNGCDSENKSCEGTNLNGKTCASLGFTSGDLACNSQCGFNANNCVIGERCGNGVIEGNELCDAANLNEKTCASLGFGSGNLFCSNCQFNTTNCVIGGEKECSPYLTVGETQGFSGTSGEEISRVAIKVGDTEYDFGLRQGENFYFVIWENIAGEKYVVTS